MPKIRRQWRSGAREEQSVGVLDCPDGDLWSRQVLGIRDGYWRVVASAEAMMEKAAQIGQKWLKGIGFARSLAANR